MNKGLFLLSTLVLVLGNAQTQMSADIASISGLNSLSSLWKQNAKEDAHKTLENPVKQAAPAPSAATIASGATQQTTTAAPVVAGTPSPAEAEAQGNLVKFRAARQHLLSEWANCLDKNETAEHVGAEVAACQPHLGNSLKIAQLVKEALQTIKTEQEKRAQAAAPKPANTQNNDLAAILARLKGMK